MRQWRGHCHRCGKATDTHIMSMFSEALICLDCSDKEQGHDDYERAREADVRAYKRGDRTFKGIGEPSDV